MKGISFITLSLINWLNILCYNIDLIEGIQGGYDVPSGQFQYQASVLINNKHACGGTPINSGNILSAGQCVVDEQGNFLDVRFDVRLGIHLFDAEDNSRQIKVDYIYIKRNFRSNNYSSYSPRIFPHTLEKEDLSILKLQHSIPDGWPVSYLALPEISGTRYLQYATSLNISGFGLDTAVNYTSSSSLHNLEYRLNFLGEMRYTKTLGRYSTYCERHYNALYDSHICATSTPDINTRTGACLGDVGGPLVHNNVVVGILQIYSHNCDDRYTPAVYTRVSSFIPFIKNARDGLLQSDMRLGIYTGAHVHEDS